jgi:hypothetical protein
MKCLGGREGPTDRAGGAEAEDGRLTALEEEMNKEDGAFDAGLRPDPFPDRASSLLPGLLTATRTGLTPAGDGELQTKS